MCRSVKGQERARVHVSRRVNASLGAALCLGIILGAVVGVIPSRAQVVTATVVGTVSDASGAVVPHATVTVANVATSISRTETTDAQGGYTIPNLDPGRYTLTAE